MVGAIFWPVAAAGQQAGADDIVVIGQRTAGSAIGDVQPIVSADQGVSPFLGHLAVNGMIGVTDVSGYGRLASSSYGGTWTSGRLVQFTATISDVLTPREIALLTNPIVTTLNTPFFDFIMGDGVLVTTGAVLQHPNRSSSPRLELMPSTLFLTVGI